MTNITILEAFSVMIRNGIQPTAPAIADITGKPVNYLTSVLSLNTDKRLLVETGSTIPPGSTESYTTYRLAFEYSDINQLAYFNGFGYYVDTTTSNWSITIYGISNLTTFEIINLLDLANNTIKQSFPGIQIFTRYFNDGGEWVDQLIFEMSSAPTLNDAEVARLFINSHLATLLPEYIDTSLDIAQNEKAKKLIEKFWIE